MTFFPTGLVHSYKKAVAKCEKWLKYAVFTLKVVDFTYNFNIPPLNKVYQKNRNFFTKSLYYDILNKVCKSFYIICVPYFFMTHIYYAH